VHRIRICRKEAKESGLWLRIAEPEDSMMAEQAALTKEAEELRKIFSAILEKSL